MAEKQREDSFRLKNALNIGMQYSTDDIARMLQKHPNALSQTGVFHGSGSDCFVIFVTLNKDKDKTPYQDHFFEPSSLLFWEGQTKMRIAEDSFDKGYDCHAFVRAFSRMPYTYYGRAVPLRQHRNAPGTPSTDHSLKRTEATVKFFIIDYTKKIGISKITFPRERHNENNSHKPDKETGLKNSFLLDQYLRFHAVIFSKRKRNASMILHNKQHKNHQN